MITKYVMRHKDTHQVFYEGTSIEDCERIMNPIYSCHRDHYPASTFKLECVQIYEPETIGEFKPPKGTQLTMNLE